MKGVHQILLLGIDLLLSSAVRISSSPFSSHSSLTFCFSDHLLTIVLDQISKQPNVIWQLTCTWPCCWRNPHFPVTAGWLPGRGGLLLVDKGADGPLPGLCCHPDRPSHQRGRWPCFFSQAPSYLQQLEKCSGEMELLKRNVQAKSNYVKEMFRWNRITQHLFFGFLSIKSKFSTFSRWSIWNSKSCGGILRQSASIRINNTNLLRKAERDWDK